MPTSESVFRELRRFVSREVIFIEDKEPWTRILWDCVLRCVLTVYIALLTEYYLYCTVLYRLVNYEVEDDSD